MESKKDYKAERIPNIVVNVPLIDFVYGRTKYNRDELVELLANIPFDHITVMVYSMRSVINNDRDQKGHMFIGKVKDFDPENEMFEIEVFGRWADVVSTFEDTVVNCRVNILDDDSLYIDSIDMNPKSVYHRNNNRRNNNRN